MIGTPNWFAAFATLPAPSPLIAKASSGSDSARSTAVYAAGFITMSGENSASAFSTVSGRRMSTSGRAPQPITMSGILVAASRSERATCPSAPMTFGLLLACYFCNMLHEAAEHVTNNPGSLSHGSQLAVAFGERMAQVQNAVMQITP